MSAPAQSVRRASTADRTLPAIATFAADVTPPIGSPLCDGLVMPARKIVDRLTAKGVVLFGAGRPIVLCAVDWVGIGNTGHDAWRQAIAAAAATTPDRVCVHALHPHDAPGCDFAAEELLKAHGLGGTMFPVAFAHRAIARVAAAVRTAVSRRVTISHVSFGRAKVERVASNRRILGTDGKVEFVRFSKSADPKVRALPEGLIDPWVRVVGFHRGGTPVAALSYYATHPQSYYGGGGVSPDFVGLARDRCEGEIEGVRWVHFNGAGGNVAAGKYNDGRPARRAELTARLAKGMRTAWRNAKRFEVSATSFGLRTAEVSLPPAPHLSEETLTATLLNKTASRRDRVRAARDLVWLRRARRGLSISLSCLSIEDVRILHLPGELFVEYQLFASNLRPDLDVCAAAYGDYGPGYIGTEVSYTQGGYETGPVSRVAPSVEPILRDGIRSLLLPADSSVGEGENATYLAGVATTKISPRKPIRLAGYANRTRPSTDVLHDLHAKALAVVDREGRRIVLITADLLGVPKALADAVCRRLHESLDLPRASIMIATSHTHTAPALTGHLGPMYGFRDEERAEVDRYTRFVEDELFDVARRAIKGLRPATIAWGVGRCDIAVNRRNNEEAAVRTLRRAGKLKGPVDHDVPVLRVADVDGKLRAIVFGYACHCTVLSFRRVSGDYAGFAQSTLETDHKGAVALFFAGCGGDQNPLPRREIDLAKRYGEALASSVEAVLGEPMQEIRGGLHSAFRTVPLAFENVPTKLMLEAKLDDANVYERRRARLLLDRWKTEGSLPVDYPFPVQVWRLGSRLTWVALGGEAVVDYSLAIKTRFGRDKTFVSAYCNDVMGYIPSARVWREGGYEGAGAMLYYGQPSRWRGDVETVVMRAVDSTARIAPTENAAENAAPKTIKDELPRIAPRSPTESRKTFRVPDGIRVELVAAEPHVADPVDMAIAEDGRIWVVEMRDYPFDERDGHEPEGRIRVLTDDDGDGVTDSSTVFADKLPWPTALLPWKKGVFVTAAPHVLYLKDENGDGRADRRTVLFDGFGKKNVQTLANNLVLRPDGWILGAGGGNGGSITSPSRGNRQRVLLRGRDFRFRPDGRFEAMTGGGQFGHSLDDFGRRFVCNNSDHARHVVLEQRYLSRNTRLGSPTPLSSIAVEGGSGPVFRLSPPEPWRIVRTRWRIAGKVKGPIEHGGAVTGYFTSATGITVYRGTSLPNSGGDLIVGDVASNLVHQKKVRADGVTFRAERAQRGRELLASDDIWFRPVNFANGPDGALYVCDMYREVVEHPWSLPEEIKEHLDLMSGRDRGRIWRVRGAASRDYAAPNAGEMSIEQLVDLLDHEDGWWRDTAARLILERNDPATGRRLREFVRDERSSAGRPAGVAAALQLLTAFGQLSEADLAVGIRHTDPGVREVAVRLAESLPQTGRLMTMLAARATDDAPRVRFQLANTLGYFEGPVATRALARLAVTDGADRWTRAAVLSSVAGARAHRLLGTIAPLDNAPRPFLHELAGLLGAARDGESVSAIFDAMARSKRTAPILILGFADGLRRVGQSFVDWRRALDPMRRNRLRPVFDAARSALEDPRSDVRRRVDAIRVHALLPFVESADALTRLLGPQNPPALQSEAVKAIALHAEAAAAERLLRGWTSYGPTMRKLVLDTIVRQDGHARVLVRHFESGTISKKSMLPAQIARLRASRDANIRGAVDRSFGANASDRGAVIARYRKALRDPSMRGDPVRGREVFETGCSVCHRHGGKGIAIGPDITTVKERTADALLEQILDPSREINPVYLSYVAETVDGTLHVGSILAETDASVTLQRADGGRDVLMRSRIRSLSTDGRSLMPNGFETTIPPKSMADLIAFLRAK